jgi:putative nucleotidyltransferase-like protein
MSSVTSSPTSFKRTAEPATRAFTPEFELLLACCALDGGSAAAGDLLARLEGVLDWPQLLSLAEHHNVLPLVHQALRGYSAIVPLAVNEQLRSQYELNARKNLKFTAELFRVLDCLETNAIPAIPFKGPLLAELVYGDLSLRAFSDLDVLVRPNDVLRAETALQTLDYTLSSQLPGAMKRAYLASGYEFTLDGPAGANLLEIQWNILPKFYAVDFNGGEFFERSVVTTLAGRRVRSLSPEDLLLVLCVHAAKHAWIRLCWLRDVAGVMQSQTLDWEWIDQRSRELGIQRMVAVSLRLANQLLGTKVPAFALAMTSTDRAVACAAEQVVSQLAAAGEYSSESLRYFRLMLGLRERARDKLRFLFRLAFTPGIGEWAVVRLPAPLFPLYRIIRLFRLAGRLSRPRT